MSLRSEVIRIINEVLGASKKISDLPAGTSPSGVELIEAVQNGESVRLTVSQVASGGVGVLSVVAGTNVTVDDTDPQNPIVSSTGGGGTVASVTGSSVDNTDPANPIVRLTDSRTVTGADAIEQTDNEKLVWFNSASPFNFTIDELDADSQVSFINI